MDWTCISQERAQQWVTMHTRILTVIFALLAAFGLQLDTVEIFRHVSSDGAARDKLVAQSAAVASQADRAFRDSNSVLQKAYEAWPDRTNPSVQAAVATIKVEPNETRESLTRRLRQALASLADHNGDLKSFNDTVDRVATDTLKEKAGDYTAVKADFDKAGFELFPGSDEGRWGYGRWPAGDRDHIWGILFSVGLLSLGAPFWYHSLKNLTSLRSTVAQNIAEEKDVGANATVMRAVGRDVIKNNETIGGIMINYEADPVFWQRFLKGNRFYTGSVDGDFGSESHAAAAVFEAQSRALAEETNRFDLRTEGNIQKLQPKAQQKAREFMKALNDALGKPNVFFKIISGPRTYAEQNALYVQGRTKFPGPTVARSARRSEQSQFWRCVGYQGYSSMASMSRNPIFTARPEESDGI